ncbi:hypothetical protein Pa4123_90960 [Phytohabitans aurantiacus]|uniref:Uncharacterized protein n=2 Tax=Phytohabitans aurantiacus TaxID=3016789 RepID=A0ABQ5RE07_9ACTN|nr:hypothetical protein Pa4123_90960 [Phytohabitans aurantiacus]
MALWALIAAGDAALLVSGVSAAVMLLVLAVAAVTALGVAAAWMLLRHAGSEQTAPARPMGAATAVRKFSR